MVSKLVLAAALIALASASKSHHNLRNYRTKKLGLSEPTGTETPVIGIVTQTLEHEMHNDTRFANYKYYIMQSYVDWVEAEGARVVPLI